jgi:hypothetical protein
MDDAHFDQNMTMEDMWRPVQLLQEENFNMRRAFEQIQVGAPHAYQNFEGAVNHEVIHLVLQPSSKPRVSLL